jgi:hypothetical protein
VPLVLARRSPGGRVPLRAENPRRVPPPPDPEAVRAEIEAFEAGVARATLYDQQTPDR